MTEQVETERRTDSINLSSVAASKVKSLLEQEGRDDLQLRISVQPGGCSGLRYQLFFDERTLDGDVVTDFDGVSVVVDRMSVPYLNGAMIDFVDSIEKQGFTIDNPNATGSCACGHSFPCAARTDTRTAPDQPVGGLRAAQALREGRAGAQSRCSESALAMRWAASLISMSRFLTSRG